MDMVSIAVRIASNPNVGIYVDLDNTLIFSSPVNSQGESEIDDEDMISLESTELDIGGSTYRVVLRPNAREFLKSLNSIGSVYLCTSATIGYADAILSAFNLYPFFKNVISRELLGKSGVKAHENVVLLDDLRSQSVDVQKKLKIMGVEYENPFLNENDYDSYDEYQDAVMDHEKEHYLKHHIMVPSYHGTTNDNALGSILSKVKQIV